MRKLCYFFTKIPKFVPLANRECFLELVGYRLPEDGTIMFTMNSAGDDHYGYPVKRNPDNVEFTLS